MAIKQTFSKFINGLNNVERSVILGALEHRLREIKTNIEANPQNYERSIIHPKLILDLVEKFETEVK